jgi:hypothetical protein
MLRGDISNDYAKRLVFVYEGLVASAPDQRAEARMRLLLRLRRWRAALRCLRTEPRVVSQMWDLTWRWDFRLDVYTYLGGMDHQSQVEKALRERLDRENIPVSNVWSLTPAGAAVRMAYAVDLHRVYDADVTRRLLYGGRGEHVGDPSTFTPRL